MLLFKSMCIHIVIEPHIEHDAAQYVSVVNAGAVADVDGAAADGAAGGVHPARGAQRRLEHVPVLHAVTVTQCDSSRVTVTECEQYRVTVT
jgi:hypothetical protein